MRMSVTDLTSRFGKINDCVVQRKERIPRLKIGPSLSIAENGNKVVY